MGAVIEAGFDYSLVEPEHRDEIRSAAARIQVRMTRTVEDIIEIGRDLIAAKKRLGHGNFLRWIETEFRLSYPAAARFMQVADRFGDKVITVIDLSPSVLYALAAPSTPDEVVEQATGRASEGEKLTRAAIEEMKAAWETERKELNEKIKAERLNARDAKATKNGIQEQFERMQEELATLRGQREALQAELDRRASASKPANPTASQPNIDSAFRGHAAQAAAEIIAEYVPGAAWDNLKSNLYASGAKAVADALTNITGQSIMDRRYGP